MQQFTIKIFFKTPEVTLLRFLSPGGKLIGERELSLHDVESFAAGIKRKYRVASVDSTTLITLGRELYDWLDGPAHRWLAGAMDGSGGLTLRIDVAERLRHLPWELLHDGDSYLSFNSQQPFTPARLVTEVARKIETQNRPLRLLFMACSAENAQPLLDFESEERMIIESARRHQIELIVEESGSLDGLRYQVEAFGSGHFDIFHLTGHADVYDERPYFLMENNQGLRLDVSAEEIADAFQGNWPRLVFLSGCKTGHAPDQGYLPSLCEVLVRAGAPAVLGWALPVGDVAASLAAAELYEHLAAGKSIDEAVARARFHLLKEKNGFWHLMRLYVNATPLDGIVTPVKTQKRARIQVREAASEFLDAGAKVEVCRREFFVGRRRSIQRCLRILQSRQGEEHYVEGVLLHGMGGLGKSSLAARLCERMPGYKRIVFVGALGNPDLDFTGRICDTLDNTKAVRLLNEPDLTLTQRLRNLFRGPLAAQSILFVFDDFEQNLEPSNNGHIAWPIPLEILKSLLTAIRDTSSESRVIITSRYKFPLPPPLKLLEEGLESLKGSDLDKKLSRLNALTPSSSIDAQIKARATQIGAGNPRLLERLDRVLADATTDAAAILDVMERKAEEFRESVLLRELLAQLPKECRRMITLASMLELPFDNQIIAAAADIPLDSHLSRAVSLGLIEAGTDPNTGQRRYFVPRVILPLVESEATLEERVEAARRAVRHLYHNWRSGSGVQMEEGLEIFRLALVAQEYEIIAEIGGRIANNWINSSRYREAELLCLKAISSGEDSQLLLDLARAQEVLGRTSEALRNYERALTICPESDLIVRSGILLNMGSLVEQQGNLKCALDLWEGALEIYEETGDIKGKAAVLSMIAGVNAKQGNVKRALDLWQQSVQLFEQIDDVRGRASAMANMAWGIALQGDVKRAVEIYELSIGLSEQIDDIHGKAEALSMMAEMIAYQGDVPRALELLQQAFETEGQIGYVKGQAATLSHIAGVLARQGEIENALDLFKRAIELYEQIGNVRGKATILQNMAAVIAQQGDINRASGLWQQSLELSEQIGDVDGKATTLCNMAAVIAEWDGAERAFDLCQQAVEIFEQTGNVKGKAVTLHSMAGLSAQRGDYESASDLCQQAIQIFEQTGYIHGKGATLNHMAWIAGKRGNVDEARRLYLKAAKSMAEAQAWLDLLAVLVNLSAIPIEGALGYLTQAVWLAINVEGPVEDALNLITRMLEKLGLEHEIAPLLATTAAFIAQKRGHYHPQQKSLVTYGFKMLVSCASVRNVEQLDKYKQWITSEGLKDPNRFLPALETALESMVGEEEWLFDRGLIGLRMEICADGQRAVTSPLQ